MTAKQRIHTFFLDGSTNHGFATPGLPCHWVVFDTPEQRVWRAIDEQRLTDYMRAIHHLVEASLVSITERPYLMKVYLSLYPDRTGSAVIVCPEADIAAIGARLEPLIVPFLTLTCKRESVSMHIYTYLPEPAELVSYPMLPEIMESMQQSAMLADG